MGNRIRTLLQISVFSILFAVAVIAATPRLGTADVPELPKADGSGASPDMMLDMVPVNVGGVSKPARMKLSSLRGKVVLMDIFWSRCHHCEEHAPHIVELYNKYRQRGFTVLGVATDNKDSKDDIANLKSFMAKAKINYPIGFLTSEIRAYYADPKDAGVPQMVLFGTDGKMVFREVGWNEKTGEKVRKAIEAQFSKAPAKAGASAPPRKAKA